MVRPEVRNLSFVVTVCQESRSGRSYSSRRACEGTRCLTSKPSSLAARGDSQQNRALLADSFAASASQKECNMEGSVSSIGQVAITVSDVEKALCFYRDVLGLPFLFSAGPQLAFLKAGEVRIMLSTPQGAGQAGANSILYFRTSDIERAHSAIIERGGVNERPPQLAAKMPDHELWLSFIRDPDGNLVGLMEEKR